MATDSSRAGSDHPACRASLMSASMPGYSLHRVGIRCRRQERPNTSGTRQRGPVLRMVRQPAEQSVKEDETQEASRRTINHLPEMTRQSYTTVHDAFVAWIRTQQLQFGADHATLDRVLVRHLDEELFAQGESAAVARLVVNESPRHPYIMSRCRRALRGFIRDKPGFPKDHCSWKR